MSTLDAKALTTERGSTHGDATKQFQNSQRLKKALKESIAHGRHDANDHTVLTEVHREALEMIMVKISRIITGNPNEPDHWDDIQGYAELGKNGGHK